MKKIIYLLCFLLIVGGISCTKKFNELNTDPSGVPFVHSNGDNAGGDNAVEDASLSLPNMMQYIYVCNGGIGAWYYQTQQNLNIDIFAGYWMPSSRTGNGAGIKNEACYTLVQNWDDNVFLAWTASMNPFLIIKSSASVYPNATNRALLGMAYVVKVMMSVRTADAIGTLPYTNFGSISATYDDLKTIYTTFFNELDSALDYLDPTATNTIGIDHTKDYFYAGNQRKWIKLVNSMRLRLAMRLAKVEPSIAKEQVQKAINGPNGLILDNVDNAYFRFITGETALTTITRSWGPGNSVVGADVYSFAQGWQDPRLSIFISPTNSTNTTSRIAIGGYVSQRLGTTGISTAPDAKVYSLPGSGIPDQDIPCASVSYAVAFFNAAETNFLLAEATLRTWQAGNAQTYYEKGIRVSMAQWQINDTTAIDAYLSSNNTPANYMDPATPEADKEAVSTCKPSWVSVSTNEEHLEQIITQKWLALWPTNSPEAWSEYRRTGYPKMFPPYISNVVPTIQWGNLEVNNARKIKIPRSEYNDNIINVNQAIAEYLGGTDDITTHVWWDVDKPNF